MEFVKESWKIIFKRCNLQNILNKIYSLKKEYADCQLDISIFPKEENIFKCFEYFEVSETKVVILGQDPYHAPQA